MERLLPIAPLLVGHVPKSHFCVAGLSSEIKIWDGAILTLVFLMLSSYHLPGHVSARVSSFAMASVSAIIDFLHTHGCDLEYSLKLLYCVLVSNFHPFWDLDARDMPCYISFLFKSLCRKVKNSHECLLERPFLRLLKENENGWTKGGAEKFSMAMMMHGKCLS